MNLSQEIREHLSEYICPECGNDFYISEDVCSCCLKYDTCAGYNKGVLCPMDTFCYNCDGSLTEDDKVTRINLTEETVYLYSGSDKVDSWQPSEGEYMSVRTQDRTLLTKKAGRTRTVAFVGVDDLPPQRKGIIYIVSLLFLILYKGDRKDLVAPDTLNNVYRGIRGNILGVSGWLTVANREVLDITV